VRAKVMVLYPQPTDPAAFERQYVSAHLPLMRRLVGPDVPLPTYRTLDTEHRPAAFYRVAEIHFESLEALQEFAAREAAGEGAVSSRSVSTGGLPIVLICVEQPPV
jgi:uncharacterized protein (TIGR02118 family)